jgi:hypothetical protein
MENALQKKNAGKIVKEKSIFITKKYNCCFCLTFKEPNFVQTIIFERNEQKFHQNCNSYVN